MYTSFYIPSADVTNALVANRKGHHMANNTIFFENPTSGQKKKAPVGISWTTLFFGPFPALMRGSFKWFAIILLTSIFTMGISHFVFMFLFNKLYIKDLIGAGFKAKSVEEGTVEQMSFFTLGVPVPVPAAAF